MHPPSRTPRRHPRWLTNPAIVVPVAIFGSIALLVAVQLAITFWPRTYELRATDALQESCFGGDERLTEAVGDDVRDYRKPQFNSEDPPTSYRCELFWDNGGYEHLTISVFADPNSGIGGYDAEIERLQGEDGVIVTEGWPEGFDDAYCTSRTNIAGHTDHDCRGAVDNMEVLVRTESDGDGERFGPNDVYLYQLASHIRLIAEEHFKAH